ncbi:M20 metallopeptidase family protein [Eggerthella sinensis]|uniref:M20 metallopeptidase family protein n=1 Tax=Eggerthella sinensis TaxID=242230 RepID=UPI0022E0DB3E|nr:M20 family metallopeptidase [Eggerthella sinensis]
MTTILEEAQALEGEIIANRRWLHEHPEIGFDLPQTTAYVAERLREIGLEPEEIVPGGLVATVGDPSSERCFMLRADMDALPIAEETGLPFASSNDYMHACGHDGHTAMLLGAARILKAHEAELAGCVKLMFQPDEEGTAPDEICGNEAMINAGVLEDPRVDAAAAIHLMPLTFKRGEVATRLGTAFSSIDDIDIVVHGKGGHGSQPHQTVDPFNIACHLYLAYQNLIAREQDPTEQCVISFGAINGGTAANVIPGDVHMLGTLRTISEHTRARMKERMEALCDGIAAAFGGSAEIQFLRGVPSVYNDPALTDELIDYVEAMTGAPVSIMDKPMSGSDDMSTISQAVPTTYFLLGTGTEDEGVHYPVHNARTTFDESVFAEGAALTATVAMRWLEARAHENGEIDG